MTLADLGKNLKNFVISWKEIKDHGNFCYGIAKKEM